MIYNSLSELLEHCSSEEDQCVLKFGRESFYVTDLDIETVQVSDIKSIVDVEITISTSTVDSIVFLFQDISPEEEIKLVNFFFDIEGNMRFFNVGYPANYRVPCKHCRGLTD